VTLQNIAQKLHDAELFAAIAHHIAELDTDTVIVVYQAP